MTEKIWLFEVLKIIYERYHLTEADLGWSESDFEKYFNYAQSPTEFVAWYASKYDLDAA